MRGTTSLAVATSMMDNVPSSPPEAASFPSNVNATAWKRTSQKSKVGPDKTKDPTWNENVHTECLTYVDRVTLAVVFVVVFQLPHNIS